MHVTLPPLTSEHCDGSSAASHSTPLQKVWISIGGGGSRVDQRFTLTNRLFGHWAVQTGLHIEHEFETEPGFEPTDTRLDVSLLYGF